MKHQGFTIFIILVFLISTISSSKDSNHIIGQSKQYEESQVSSLWTFPTGNAVRTAALFDLDGDQSLEVIVGSADGNVYAVHGLDGSLFWNYSTGASIIGSVAIADLDTSGSADVVVSSNGNKIIAIDGLTGTELWNNSIGSGPSSSPSIAYLDGMGNYTVVGGYDGNVYALNWTGGIVWTFSTGDEVISSPAIGNLDGDAELEVVIGCQDNRIYAIDGGTGNQQWMFTTGGDVYSSPALGDVDKDGGLDVVVGSLDGKVYAIDGQTGMMLWEELLGGEVSSSPALGDVDGDDYLDVAIGCMDGNVSLLNGDDGSRIWSSSIGSPIYSSPALGDIDGNGQLDVIVGDYLDSYHALSGNDGHIIWSYETGDHAQSAPALGDIDDDDRIEVIVGSDDFSLHAIDVSNSGNRIFWQGHGGTTYFTRTRCVSEIDFDNDHLSWYSEKYYGTSSADPDTDEDGMPDGWEVTHALNPLVDDSGGDPDGDGNTNLQEYLAGTNPRIDETTITSTTTTNTATPTGGDGSLFVTLTLASVLGSGVISVVAIVYIQRRKRFLEDLDVVDVSQPVAEAGIEALRGGEFVGNRFRFKVKIVNNSEFIITDATVTLLAYPKDSLKLDGDVARVVPKIDSQGFRSPTFEFVPTQDCVKGNLIASVSFVDHRGQAHSITTEPYTVRAVCDLLTPESISPEEFELKLSNLEHGDLTLEVEDWTPEEMHTKTLKILDSSNFFEVSVESRRVGEHIEIRVNGWAKGKYTGKNVGTEITITGKPGVEGATCAVKMSGEDNAMILPAIDEISHKLGAWLCPRCSGVLPEESVKDLKEGRSSVCTFCGVTVDR